MAAETYDDDREHRRQMQDLYRYGRRLRQHEERLRRLERAIFAGVETEPPREGLTKPQKRP